MGVRLYNPTTGRFLSTDPVFQSGTNAYDYVGQDINARYHRPYEGASSWHTGIRVDRV